MTLHSLDRTDAIAALRGMNPGVGDHRLQAIERAGVDVRVTSLDRRSLWAYLQ